MTASANASTTLRGTKETLSVADLLNEPYRLLGRPERNVSLAEFTRLVSGKKVLITGGGGSIGAQLCHALHLTTSCEVTVLDRDESALEAVLLGSRTPGRIRRSDLILADIRHSSRLVKVISQIKPDILFHAAALKHVPLLENHPEEAFLTNVLGTINVLSAADSAGVPIVINLSTDKAADPISVLGNSKYIAERLTAYQARRNPRTKYISVRLCNVLATRGSVLEVFETQIAKGGPLTITDARATRYLMTAREAVTALMNACINGQSGDTLVPDMGLPINISAMAEIICEDCAGGRVGVEYVGLRPGEKLYEVLVAAHENAECGPDPSFPIRVRVEPLDPAAVQSARDALPDGITNEWLAGVARQPYIDIKKV